jgi:hypothetical protein
LRVESVWLRSAAGAAGDAELSARSRLHAGKAGVQIDW